MPFQIHFRGVGVFVARGGGNITEVLFPNAETKGPPDGDKGKERPNGKPVGKGMKHADKSEANLHFAGALIVGPGNTATYRKLSGRLVTRDRGMAGATPRGDFFLDVPPLAEVITETDSKLKLIKPTNGDYVDHVATRFEIDTGTVEATPPSKKTWALDGGKHGGRVERNFALGVTWTLDEAGPVEFQVRNLDGTPTGEEPIVLHRDRTQVYFYNFDLGLPSVSDLTATDDSVGKVKVDHDFKWSYALFERADGDTSKKWPHWLKRDVFPAPTMVGKLIPVSTCFQIVWTGE